MPIVNVELWEGRGPEIKKTLGQNITNAVSESIGCPKEHVIVIIKDSPKHNWTIGGKFAPDMKV
ncbi:MAG: 2-hydroxymuconate tautomerase [Candidatus Omnitrophota bacterium]